MAVKKVAVIGCGTIGTSEHIPAYIKNEKSEIKYFCDIIPEKAQAMVDKYGCGTAITDYHDILKDPEVAAVSVCVPNYMHSKIAIDCLNAGKNVLCEKPAATTYEEALAMQDAQEKSGKILNIGVVNRFNPAVVRIKNLIDSGELGEVYHVYCSFRSYRSIPGWGGWFTTKAMSGGGVLIDWGIHFLDLILYCINEAKTTAVSGKAYCKLGKKLDDYVYTGMWAGPPKKDGIDNVEDFVTGLIRTEGPTISLNGAWAQNLNENEMFIDFLGTKGGIRLQYGANFKLYSTKNGALTETIPTYMSEQPFENEIDAFLDCIDTHTKIRSNIDHAVKTSQIMEAIYESSDKGKEIILEDVR